MRCYLLLDFLRNGRHLLKTLFNIVEAPSTVKVEIFAHFAAKWSGANIMSKCVFACASLLSAKLKTCEIHLSRLGAKN